MQNKIEGLNLTKHIAFLIVIVFRCFDRRRPSICSERPSFDTIDRLKLNLHRLHHHLRVMTPSRRLSEVSIEPPPPCNQINVRHHELRSDLGFRLKGLNRQHSRRNFPGVTFSTALCIPRATTCVTAGNHLTASVSQWWV
ncbi:hypothetical protein HanIR_Chr13g0652941 [Helianthus annuus]|nr:hypothetical protein HanIR_Chr13g0652941 [Helianthus annuus]